MRLNLAGEVGVHGGLGSGANSNGLLQIRFTSLCHPCYFGSESLDVFLLSLQVI